MRQEFDLSMQGPRSRASGHAPARSVRVACALVLLAHVVLASLALRFLPQGFPVFHPRSVLGTLAPVCIGVGSLALGAALAFAPRAAGRFLPALPALWASAALALFVLFPVTGVVAARTLGLVALVLALGAALACRRYSWLELTPAVLLGGAFGQLVARCERPSPANTHPLPAERAPARAAGERVSGRLELERTLAVESSSFEVIGRGARTTITIAPVLAFSRTSPDGFWSIFAPDAAPAPSFTTATSGPDELRLSSSDGSRRLSVRHTLDHLELDAWTLLERPAYSHLNSFTKVEVRGHRRLGLRFSPCPASVIAVTHADYPAGAPARFAYVDAARRFHVVQATDAEKGPFASLAEGQLPADATLDIELVDLGDGARTFARLEFADFAGELSTALSPTAGYGVAENAVEFGLADADPSSPAELVLTLAASGVGRGWDSVGHRAGAYRNRVRLRSFDSAVLPEPRAPLDEVGRSVCIAIARDIAQLKPRFPALATFDPTAVRVGGGECSFGHSYHTHASTRRGGWAAQVPEPDPDGVWFHVGVWDPNGPARLSQINTQPGFSVYALGDENVTVLMLAGAEAGALRAALWSLLRRHGVGELRR